MIGSDLTIGAGTKIGTATWTDADMVVRGDY
jgi:hypothetical protein